MSQKKSHAPAAARAGPDKPVRRVRDRIFETACELFYRHGIRGVGVDAIANGADTNKMSFYRSFPSKEKLVAEYLRQQEREYWAFWDGVIAPHAGDPRRQIEALFDAHAARSQGNCERGCALANAAVEIGDDDPELAEVVRLHKTEMRKRLRTLARALNARDPDLLGDGLMLLLEGGHYTRLTFGGGRGPIAAAPAAARALIEAHTRR